jgi:hypothetical protein
MPSRAAATRNALAAAPRFHDLVAVARQHARHEAANRLKYLSQQNLPCPRPRGMAVF